MSEKMVYALDFDGVICDSAVETGITGWKAATEIWSDMQGSLPATELIDGFRQVRPMLETGYEAILIMRLLYQGKKAEDVQLHYNNFIQQALLESGKETDFLKQLFGETRDSWIQRDPQEWVVMNPLFSGVAEKLQQLGQRADWYIVTTKQERFVSQILQANDIDIATDRIFGLDRNMNKVEVLTRLLNKHIDSKIIFIEDRLPTLLNVLTTEHLASIQLLLADWGYNTDEDMGIAKQQLITIIGVEDFLSA